VAKVNLNNPIVSVLDVGSTKVCCLIAKKDELGELNIIGVGHRNSFGIRNGQVIDLLALEDCVRESVSAAEKMANHRIFSVFVNASSGNPRSSRLEAEMVLSKNPVSSIDVRNVLDNIGGRIKKSDFELIHCIPTGYSIDGSNGIVDPRGMHGERLGVNVHLITASLAQSRNFSKVIEKCHLDIKDKVFSGYASALACLVDDEKELGATLIDMGGGTTTISVFHEGFVDFVDTIPLGGMHVTNDIAKGLSTPLQKAERLKTVYGSVNVSSSDDRELLRVPLIGEEDDIEPSEIPRSMLIRIIEPRLVETLEYVRNSLEISGSNKKSGRRVVITGGASQLDGIKDLAELILDKQVRLSRPRNIKGLPESVSGPAFSTSVGLLQYAVKEKFLKPRIPEMNINSTENNFGRISEWLKKHF